jgi:tight adherence protein B
MMLLSGLFAGLFVYLALGVLFGLAPAWLRPTIGERRSEARWRDWLHQAGVDVSPLQFASVSVGLAALVGLVVVFVVGVPVLAVIAGGVALALPRSVFARRREALIRQRLAAWPDALRDLVGHLRSSHSIHAALCEVGRSGPLALRPYFNRYAGLAVALDHRTALEVVREELADPLSDRIIEVLLVAFDQGSSLVIDILEDLAVSSANDLRLVDEIETLQLETKLEARGSAVLPFAVLAMLCAFTPGYRDFYTSPLGWVVVALGTVMALAGLFAIQRLGRVPSEERILAAGGAR